MAIITDPGDLDLTGIPARGFLRVENGEYEDPLNEETTIGDVRYLADGSIEVGTGHGWAPLASSDIRPNDTIRVDNGSSPPESYTVTNVSGNTIELADPLNVPLTGSTITIQSPANNDIAWWDAGSIAVPLKMKNDGEVGIGGSGGFSISGNTYQARVEELDLALTNVLISLKQALDVIPEDNTEAREIICEEILRVEKALEDEDGTNGAN